MVKIISKKADFEISELVKWVLIIISIIAIMFLIRGWINSAAGINIFRR